MAGDRHRRQVTCEEEKLWRQAMRDARPLAGRAPPEPSAPPAPPAGNSPPARLAPPLGGELRHDRAPGVDRRTAQRLRRGNLAIEAVIDLHGLTQEAAHATLLRFISGSAELERRVVLVVTGKGSRDGAGVLRHQVPHWLNQPTLRGHILAFTHAQPKHGGEGALYVLLKRRRPTG
jgi:DNA-nicking Smr family endonuclease